MPIYSLRRGIPYTPPEHTHHDPPRPVLQHFARNIDQYNPLLHSLHFSTILLPSPLVTKPYPQLCPTKQSAEPVDPHGPLHYNSNITPCIRHFCRPPRSFLRNLFTRIPRRAFQRPAHHRSRPPRSLWAANVATRPTTRRLRDTGIYLCTEYREIPAEPASRGVRFRDGLVCRARVS